MRPRRSGTGTMLMKLMQAQFLTTPLAVCDFERDVGSFCCFSDTPRAAKAAAKPECRRRAARRKSNAPRAQPRAARAAPAPASAGGAAKDEDEDEDEDEDTDYELVVPSSSVACEDTNDFVFV